MVHLTEKDGRGCERPLQASVVLADRLTPAMNFWIATNRIDVMVFTLVLLPIPKWLSTGITIISSERDMISFDLIPTARTVQALAGGAESVLVIAPVGFSFSSFRIGFHYFFLQSSHRVENCGRIAPQPHRRGMNRLLRNAAKKPLYTARLIWTVSGPS
jgi:hypothetical protein